MKPWKLLKKLPAEFRKVLLIRLGYQRNQSSDRFGYAGGCCWHHHRRAGDESARIGSLGPSQARASPQAGFFEGVAAGLVRAGRPPGHRRSAQEQLRLTWSRFLTVLLAVDDAPRLSAAGVLPDESGLTAAGFPSLGLGWWFNGQGIECLLVPGDNRTSCPSQVCRTALVGRMLQERRMQVMPYGM